MARRDTIWTVPFLALIFALALEGWTGILFAQEPDVAALQSRIRQLEQQVKELEAVLKDSVEAQKRLAQGNTSGWQNKKNWRRLSPGMQDGEVREILGEPSKVIQGVKTLWYYPNLYCGYVTFDEKGQLAGWSEP